MNLYSISSHDGSYRELQDHESLDSCIEYLLEGYWAEPNNQGFLVCFGGLPLAVLTTCHADSYCSGIVCVSRFDGLTPRHELHRVEYRLSCDGEFETVARSQITESEMVQVA